MPFKVNGCENLDFKPKLFMRVFGGTRRAKSPKLRAILVARDGDANIGRASVKLPKPLILEQSQPRQRLHPGPVRRPRLPERLDLRLRRSDYAAARRAAKGPVYLRSSSHELPDMVAALNGQVDVVLDGRIDSVKGRLRTTFDTVPDVPVSKFVVTVRGGKTRPAGQLEQPLREDKPRRSSQTASFHSARTARSAPHEPTGRPKRLGFPVARTEGSAPPVKRRAGALSSVGWSGGSGSR